MITQATETRTYSSERRRGISIAVGAIVSAAIALIGFVIRAFVNRSSTEESFPIIYLTAPLALIVAAARGVWTYLEHTPTITLTPTHLIIRTGPAALLGQPHRIALDRIHTIRLLLPRRDFHPPHTLAISADGVVDATVILTYRAPERKSVHTETIVKLGAIPGGAELLREIIRRVAPQIVVQNDPQRGRGFLGLKSLAHWKTDLEGGWKIDPHDFRMEGPPRLPESREENVGDASLIWGPKRAVAIDQRKVIPPDKENADAEGDLPSTSA
jgi:hypothetical protein